MKDLIFEHFVPITWEPGHMGAFLANFLTLKSSYPIPFSQQGGLLPNKEWFFVDAFDNFLGSTIRHNGKYDKIRQTLPVEYSGAELIEMIAIELIKQKYRWFTKKTDLTFEILKNNSSRYLKEHPFKESLYPFEDIVWKNKKIYCRFPYEKLWIPYFLLKYKYGTNDPEFIEITKILMDGYENTYPEMRPLHNTYDYITFDIYDLIFNKNLDQVYSIDPAFEFNDDKRDMLDLAHTTSIEILELFGLDHTWSIDHTTKIKDVLNKPTKDPGTLVGRVFK
jgi:hypothetical protein